MKPFLISERPIEKMYFTAPEIAKMIGESAQTVRRWTKVFCISKRPGYSSWLYTNSAVTKFMKIHNLVRKEKYTLEGAKIKLIRNENRIKSHVRIS